MDQVVTTELYMTFRKMCLEFKLKVFGGNPKEQLLIAWYQSFCRFYPDEAEMADWEVGMNVMGTMFYRRPVSENSILTGNEEMI